MKGETAIKRWLAKYPKQAYQKACKNIEDLPIKLIYNLLHSTKLSLYKKYISAQYYLSVYQAYVNEQSWLK